MWSWYQTRCWPNKVMRVNCAVLMALILVLEPLQVAWGQEIVVQNDTVTVGNSAAIQAGFVAHDIGAAVFELPPGVDALKVNTVQILFLSEPAHALHTFGNVHLYCGGFPDPGQPVKTVGGVGLNPDYLNQIDVSRDGWLVQAAEGPFTVGFEYLWKVGGPITSASGHLVTDDDGCQTGKNLVFDAATSAWLDPCPHTGGDFVIRVIGEPFYSKAPFGDFNSDSAVDMADFAALQRCLSLPEWAGATPECVAAFDCDGNGRVDAADVLQFVTCARGPAVMADPACGPCLPASVCPGQLLSAVRQRVSGADVEPRIIWLKIIIILVALLLVGSILKGCYDQAQLTAQQNAFISAAVPLSSSDLDKVRQAITFLRDILGAVDPEAHRAGQYLATNDYGTDCCKVQKVPLGQNRSGLIAVQPHGTDLIIMDEKFLSIGFYTEVLAMILYSEWCHLDDPCFFKEDTQQGKLDQFRQIHGYENVLPEMKHGAPEGAAY